MAEVDPITIATDPGAAALADATVLAEHIGARPVASEAEAAALKHISDQLKAAGLVPRRQSLRAPRSEWGAFIMVALSSLLGVLLWMLLGRSLTGAYLGAILIGFGLWELYAKLNFTWSPLSGLVPTHETENIIATVEPTEDIGRHAVVFAHTDSQRTPLIFTSSTMLKLALIAFYAAVIILTLTLIALVVAWFIQVMLPEWVAYPALAASVVMLVFLVQAELSPYGPGANDNASAVGVSLALARHFREHPLRHTRLWFVYTAAEETGCHGAAAFLAGEGSELVQAYALALEGSGVQPPAYSTREGMLGSYRTAPEMRRVLEKVAKAHPDLGLRPANLRGGYTEAGLAIRRGYRAVALVGLDDSDELPGWHTAADTADQLDPAVLQRHWDAARLIIEELDRLPTSARLSEIVPLSQR